MSQHQQAQAVQLVLREPQRAGGVTQLFDVERPEQGGFRSQIVELARPVPPPADLSREFGPTVQGISD